MRDNIDLFAEEIEEIKEFSGLDMDLFQSVLNCTREVVVNLGDSVSPVAVVDIIEGAVGNLIYNTEKDKQPVTVEDAVERAVVSLGLGELGEMFDEIALEDGTDYSDTKSMK